MDENSRRRIKRERDRRQRNSRMMGDSQGDKIWQDEFLFTDESEPEPLFTTMPEDFEPSIKQPVSPADSGILTKKSHLYGWNIIF